MSVNKNTRNKTLVHKILGDKHITIADIQTLSAKGQNMTLAEIFLLPETSGVYDPQQRDQVLVGAIVTPALDVA